MIFDHRVSVLSALIGFLLLSLSSAQQRVLIQPVNPEDVSNFDLRDAAIGAGGVPVANVDLRGNGGNIIAAEFPGDVLPPIALPGGVEVIVEIDREVVPATVDAPPWSLDRIDQAAGTDGAYLPPMLQPCGDRRPFVYVCDTGILSGHDEFTTAGDRLRFVGSYIPPLLQRTFGAFEDPWDHGTAVTACALGETTGAGRCPADIVSAVCYPDPGVSGSTFVSFAADAIYWCLNEHNLRNEDDDPFNDASVLVFASTTASGTSQILDLAIQRARLDGMTVVVAAGNQNQLASSVSPAGAFSSQHGDITLTVAASDNADARWAMSNYGDRVELFAPAVDVPGASGLDPVLCTLRSGTSLATGYVAGAATRALSQNPWASPLQIDQYLSDQSDPVFGPSGPFGMGIDAVPKLLFVHPSLTPCLPLRYGVWSKTYGAPATDRFTDPDGDGLVNVIEYLMGSNPLVYDTDRPEVRMVGNEPRFHFQRANYLCDDSYFVIETSPDCRQWSAVPASDIHTDTAAPCGEGVTAKIVLFPSASPQTYVRLRALDF